MKGFTLITALTMTLVLASACCKTVESARQEMLDKALEKNHLGHTKPLFDLVREIKIDAERRKMVEDAYNHIRSEKALAPTWFKEGVRDFDAVLEEVRRGDASIFPLSLRISHVTLRLIVLNALLHPVFWTFLFLRRGVKSGFGSVAGAFIGSIVGMYVLIWMAGGILTATLTGMAYVVMGEGYYVPYPFALFLLFSFLNISIVYLAFRPILKLQESVAVRGRILSGALMFLNICGLIFTVRDLGRLLVSFFF